MVTYRFLIVAVPRILYGASPGYFYYCEQRAAISRRGKESSSTYTFHIGKAQDSNAQGRDKDVSEWSAVVMTTP